MGNSHSEQAEERTEKTPAWQGNVQTVKPKETELPKKTDQTETTCLSSTSTLTHVSCQAKGSVAKSGEASLHPTQANTSPLSQENPVHTRAGATPSALITAPYPSQSTPKPPSREMDQATKTLLTKQRPEVVAPKPQVTQQRPTAEVRASFWSPQTPATSSPPTKQALPPKNIPFKEPGKTAPKSPSIRISHPNGTLVTFDELKGTLKAPDSRISLQLGSDLKVDSSINKSRTKASGNTKSVAVSLHSPSTKPKPGISTKPQTLPTAINTPETPQTASTNLQVRLRRPKTIRRPDGTTVSYHELKTRLPRKNTTSTPSGDPGNCMSTTSAPSGDAGNCKSTISSKECQDTSSSPLKVPPNFVLSKNTVDEIEDRIECVKKQKSLIAPATFLMQTAVKSAVTGFPLSPAFKTVPKVKSTCREAKALKAKISESWYDFSTYDLTTEPAGQTETSRFPASKPDTSPASPAAPVRNTVPIPKNGLFSLGPDMPSTTQNGTEKLSEIQPQTQTKTATDVAQGITKTLTGSTTTSSPLTGGTTTESTLSGSTPISNVEVDNFLSKLSPSSLSRAWAGRKRLKKMRNRITEQTSKILLDESPGEESLKGSPQTPPRPCAPNPAPTKTLSQTCLLIQHPTLINTNQHQGENTSRGQQAIPRPGKQSPQQTQANITEAPGNTKTDYNNFNSFNTKWPRPFSAERMKDDASEPTGRSQKYANEFHHLFGNNIVDSNTTMHFHSRKPRSLTESLGHGVAVRSIDTAYQELAQDVDPTLPKTPPEQSATPPASPPKSRKKQRQAAAQARALARSAGKPSREEDEGQKTEDTLPATPPSPEHPPRPSGRWHPFTVDGTCRRRACCVDGALAPNVTRWLNVNRNYLCEPPWMTTAKLAALLALRDEHGETSQ